MPSNFLNALKVPLLGGLFFCFCFTAQAADWRHKQWQRLLHYEKSLTGNYVSEVDGKDFFLHPRGKTSPSKELNEFIKQVQLPASDIDAHAYCRFPARWRWLKTQNPDLVDPSLSCPKLTAFRKRLSAKSVAMVFSSYYVNNPSSSFGHTLLRFGNTAASGSGASVQSELLDTGINFGAVTGDAGPLLYTVGGLAGWFPGTFNAIPYYYKVREYNDFETRDLWSYQLKLNQPDIDFMVDHVWELGHSYFDYYFLTENCSYHMLTIIEAARPDIDLIRHLPKLYIIPTDTLKALDKENLISEVSFRPAPSTLFTHLNTQLSSLEREETMALLKNPEHRFEMEDKRKALVYDSAIALVDFKYAKDILKEQPEALARKRPLLLSRSKIPVRSEDPDFRYKLPSSPHLGHGSNRLMTSGFVQSDHVGMDLNWRFAYHDILDYEVAYPHRSKVEVMQLSARSFGQDLQFRELSLMDLLNLGKWDRFNHSASWKARLGQWQTRKDKRDFSTQGFTGGYGYSYHWQHFTPYLLAHFEGSYISEKFRQVKVGYGTDLGLLFDFTESFKLSSVFAWRGSQWEESRLNNELRLSNKIHGLGAYYQDYLTSDDYEIGLRYLIYL